MRQNRQKRRPAARPRPERASSGNLIPMRQRRKRLPRQKPPRRFLRDNRRKLLVAFGSIVLLLTALIVRLTYINVSSGETYTRQVLSQLNYNSTTIP